MFILFALSSIKLRRLTFNCKYLVFNFYFYVLYKISQIKFVIFSNVNKSAYILNGFPHDVQNFAVRLSRVVSQWGQNLCVETLLYGGCGGVAWGYLYGKDWFATPIEGPISIIILNNK